MPTSRKLIALSRDAPSRQKRAFSSRRREDIPGGDGGGKSTYTALMKSVIAKRFQGFKAVTFPLRLGSEKKTDLSAILLPMNIPGDAEPGKVLTGQW